MYFWKIEELKKDIREGKLSQQQDLYYLLAIVILTGIGLIPAFEYNQYDQLMACTYLGISIVGVIKAFSSNGGQQGKDFTKRFLAVAWVTMFRVFVPVFILMSIFYIAFFQYATEEATAIDLGVSITFSILHFWRICVHLNDLAQEDSEAPLQELDAKSNS